MPNESQPSAPSQDGRASHPGGNAVLRWLLVRDEFSRARQAAARVTPVQRESLRRAELALELGTYALAPGNALRSGSGAPLAADLFRQAVYWTLLAQSSEVLASPEAVWAAADSALLASAAGSEAALTEVAAAVGSSFIDLAQGSPEQQRVYAERLRRFASRLLREAQRGQWQLEWLWLKRLLRLLLVLLPVALGVAVLLHKPDLAKGKPWRTSSEEYKCYPNRLECGGKTTDILFHTKTEESPWFEYDFGVALAFSSLVVRNRSDFGPERAIPLIVELSNDGKEYREVARRSEPFIVWRPSFTTERARYLRLRVPRQTMLHLEAVSVYR